MTLLFAGVSLANDSERRAACSSDLRIVDRRGALLAVQLTVCVVWGALI